MDKAVQTDSNRKIRLGLIAWTRFGFGGVSRVVSSLINNLSDDVEIKVLSLKKRKFFENVYSIDTRKVEFSFMEMNALQKARREVVNRGYLRRFSEEFRLNNFVRIKYSPFYLNKIASWINKNQFDVVMFATGFEDCIQLAAIKKKIKTPTKIIAWSHCEFGHYFWFSKKPKDTFSAKLYRKWYGNFDDIVVLSDDDARMCQEVLGFHATRIYNPNSFTPKGRTNLKNKKFLYVGDISQTKGSDILVDAFIEFSKTNTDWGLSLVGQGALVDELRQKVQDAGVSDRVTFYPFTLNVEEMYLQHDVFILPSRIEGFGIVQIEAASCGLPVISSDVPISKELIGRYGHGLLFERKNVYQLAQRMHEIVEMDLQTMSDEAVRAASEFTIANIMNQWKSLFNTLKN